MAKEKTSTVGAAHKTTIMMTPKSVLEDLLKETRNAKKRTQSISGKIGEQIAKAVEEKHLDRKAFSIARQLDALDEERLHLTYYNLLYYLDVLGVVKRATAQEEMFEPGEQGEPTGTFRDPAEKPAKTAKNVTTFPSEGRRTAEQAGAAE